MIRKRIASALILLSLALTACTAQPAAVPTAETEPETASSCPLKDGSYTVAVESSSSMFRIIDCTLTVENGQMRAEMTMGGTGYLKVYMGTPEEAEKASDADCIPFNELPDGAHSFTVPVEALDTPIDCAAFSKKKETWYERTLVFRADSLPTEAFADGYFVTAETLGLADGEYSCEALLSGGSGRAGIQSPAALRVENGEVFAEILWSSGSYDYMRVGGERYDALSTDGASLFKIPVAYFDRPIAVTANTVAMSTPHEIEYTLLFDSGSITKADAVPVREELSFAKEFAIDKYPNGSILLTIGENRYFVIPENCECSESAPEGATVLQRPIENVYLQATSAMDLICALDAIDHVKLSGTQEDGWYVPAAAEAMARGDILYAGKYSAPDYETILENDCGLAIASTMILHKPEVIEQFAKLGVPTLIERSSYENDPLGRMEWVKVYGVLFGKEELAERIFEEKTAAVKALMNAAPTGKSAAFFYINSNGSVTVHKPGGYVARMVELAGGKYLPEGAAESDSALSTENMQLEAFYAAARDADVLIYNSAIDGGIMSIAELCDKCAVLSDFRAVREGNVWCTDRSLFQQSMSLGALIEDMHAVFSDHEASELKFLYRLN